MVYVECCRNYVVYLRELVYFFFDCYIVVFDWMNLVGLYFVGYMNLFV